MSKTLLSVCTYLDPRFKYIEDGMSTILTIDFWARKGIEIIEEETSQPASSTGSAPPEATEASTFEYLSSAYNSSKKHKLSSWLKEAAETQVPPGEPLTPEQKAKRELEEYERLPLLNSELDPLEWWKVHQVVLPTLSKLVQKYLCICSSSSAMERIFSCSGNIVSKKCTLLKPVKVNMLVFLARSLYNLPLQLFET